MIKGCGHQSLCDLAHTLPHWLNVAVRNTLDGAASAEMDLAVQTCVIEFLQGAGVLGPLRSPEAVDLSSIPATTAHVQGRALP